MTISQVLIFLRSQVKHNMPVFEAQKPSGKMMKEENLESTKKVNMGLIISLNIRSGLEPS